ncbi:hypothetical protein KQX54_019131 [Cotesia glomerata]|uniref:Uncharacterized protein n=1 Tax=Cotesia glomerata TaxID=32391 RepID=A0AAV7IZ94_COTGL|nr:hypothetical protein KQX54_019131 [Cotesia glomerata]
MKDFEIEDFSTYRQPFWSPEMESMLMWIRFVDYKQYFKTRRWSDVDFPRKSLWNAIANDPRLQNRFTGVDCWLRFSSLVKKYNVIYFLHI